VRSPLLLPLVFGAYLLPTPNAFAAAKAPKEATIRRGPALATLKDGPKEKLEASPAMDERAQSDLASAGASVQIHRVGRGETVGQVASHYGTPEKLLRALNGLASDESIRPGQILFVPGHEEKPPVRSASRNATWRRYSKPPKEQGAIDIATRTARFVGLVIDKQGGLRPVAVRSLNSLLGAGGKHPPLPERLIRLIVKVSDTFGGRSIRVVDGYRSNSYYQDSRHRLSAAVDFALADVPNAALCEYLRELDDVGVGYYPNSTFVHLDVRKQSAYWIDYAGPGEPPRSTPNAPRPAHGSKRWLLAELDALVNQTKQGLERAGTETPRDAPAPTAPKLEPPPSDREQPPALGDAIASSRDTGGPGPL
jgi:LysM repeat protein